MKQKLVSIAMMAAVIFACFSCKDPNGPNNPKNPDSNIIYTYSTFISSLVGMEFDDVNAAFLEKGFTAAGDGEYALELTDENILIYAECEDFEDPGTVNAIFLEMEPANEAAVSTTKSLENTYMIDGIKALGSKVRIAKNIDCTFKVAALVSEKNETQNFIYEYNDDIFDLYINNPGTYDIAEYYWSSSDASTEAEIMEEISDMNTPGLMVGLFSIDGTHSSLQLEAFKEIPEY